MAREKDTIICDLDGTIALDHKRNHFLHPHEHINGLCECKEKGGRDWNAYFDACGGDEPNWAVIDLLRLFWEDGYNIRILTGRTERVRAITEKWLSDHAVPHHSLRMRPEEEFTDDHQLKVLWAKEEKLEPDDVLFILEDRQRVVDSWRAAGYTCFQVAPGTF